MSRWLDGWLRRITINMYIISNGFNRPPYASHPMTETNRFRSTPCLRNARKDGQRPTCKLCLSFIALWLLARRVVTDTCNEQADSDDRAMAQVSVILSATQLRRDCLTNTPTITSTKENVGYLIWFIPLVYKIRYDTTVHSYTTQFIYLFLWQRVSAHHSSITNTIYS